jgi:arylformamidase
MLRQRISRRLVLSSLTAAAAAPAVAEECRIGPTPHERGTAVFLDYDKVELDAAYNQTVYEPRIGKVAKRRASLSEEVRSRLGQPERHAYGQSDSEQFDLYKTKHPQAPIFLAIHGGEWRAGSAKNYAFPAELFVNAGAHYIAIDYVLIKEAGGDLRAMAEQVRRSIAWVYKNAASFGGDPNRLYIGGHSAGGHLCGVALVTDWQRDFGVPANIVKGGLCMSGMYDMKPVRLSFRSSYVSFTDESEEAMSPLRHLERLSCPIVVTYGTDETPEFQRQSRDFAAAVKSAGKAVTLIEAANFAHLEMAESLANPYGPNGRAALAMMGLAST